MAQDGVMLKASWCHSHFVGWFLRVPALHALLFVHETPVTFALSVAVRYEIVVL